MRISIFVNHSVGTASYLKKKEGHMRLFLLAISIVLWKSESLLLRESFSRASDYGHSL